MKWSKLGTWLERFQRSNLRIRNGGGCKHRTVNLSHLKNSLIFSDPVVPGIDVNLCIIQRSWYKYTRYTIYAIVFDNTYSWMCCGMHRHFIPSSQPDWGQLWLQLHHHRQRQSRVLFCFVFLTSLIHWHLPQVVLIKRLVSPFCLPYWLEVWMSQVEKFWAKR